MHVTFLTIFYPPQIGGIQVLLEQVSQGLVKKWGHSVLVLTRTWPNRPAQEQIQGVSIIRIPGLEKNQPLRLSVELWRRLNASQTNLLICVEPRLRWALPAILVTRLLGIPMLLLLAGTSSEAAHPISRWIAGVGARKIIGISNYALAQYGLWPSRWNLIYCGANTNRLFSPPNYDERKNIVLTVARVAPRKNLEMVIRVAHILPQYQFFIVGDNTDAADYFNLLQQLVEELQIRNVIFTNKVSDEARDHFYRESKVFFLPTIHEMFGIVFVEAMAAGLPVVSTNVTAVPEVVPPQAGRLLSLSSSPQAFAQEIEMLMTNRQIWSTLSANAFQRAAEFSWDKTVHNYAEVCAQIVSKG